MTNLVSDIKCRMKAHLCVSSTTVKLSLTCTIHTDTNKMDIIGAKPLRFIPLKNNSDREWLSYVHSNTNSRAVLSNSRAVL